MASDAVHSTPASLLPSPPRCFMSLPAFLPPFSFSAPIPNGLTMIDIPLFLAYTCYRKKGGFFMLRTPAKVWLWIILIINILSTLSYVRLIPVSPLFGVLLLLSFLLLAAIGILLFGHRKLGFYLLCGVAVVIFFLNLYVHVNFFIALSAMILSPLITYLFIRSSWNYLS